MKGFKLKSSELDVFDLETKSKKNQIMMSGICYGVICAIFAGFYWARFNSVMNAQTIPVDQGAPDDRIYFD